MVKANGRNILKLIGKRKVKRKSNEIETKII